MMLDFSVIPQLCCLLPRHPGLEPGSTHPPLGAAAQWIPAQGRNDGRGVVATDGAPCPTSFPTP
jgi:hypothetical protein